MSLSAFSEISSLEAQAQLRNFEVTAARAAPMDICTVQMRRRAKGPAKQSLVKPVFPASSSNHLAKLLQNPSGGMQ